MSEAPAKATTMDLPVKLVRQIATLSINAQCQLLKERVLEVADRINAIRETDNATMYHRFMKAVFGRKDQPMLEREAAYEEWKQLYLADRMDMYHPAYVYFSRTRTTWWKRLKQFSELPEADSNKTLRMSMEDLDLIDYTIFLPQVTKAKEQA